MISVKGLGSRSLVNTSTSCC